MELINILANSFSGWCAEEGVQNAFSLVRNVLEILRIVVPIALIAMTTYDIIVKVINPDEKEGQKKIMNRILAAVIVFFIPTIISLVFKLIDIGNGSGSSYDDSRAGLSACWGGDYGK